MKITLSDFKLAISSIANTSSSEWLEVSLTDTEITFVYEDKSNKNCSVRIYDARAKATPELQQITKLYIAPKEMPNGTISKTKNK